MKTSIRLFLYTILATAPTLASAQSYSELMQEVLADKQGYYADVVAPQPIVPVVPVIPAYPRNLIPPNPYGTGYSVVTTQTTQPNFIQQYMGIRGASTSVSVTSVVPNNAWGAPLRPPLLFPYP